MRKIMYVVSSIAAVLFISAVLVPQAGRLAVVVKAGEPGPGLVPTRSTASHNLMPQNGPFIWINYGEEQDYAGYKRVVAGIHQDGSKLYICNAQMRNGIHPGKLYQNRCFVPWDGKENVFASGYKVLLTNTTFRWVDLHSLSDAQIERSAIKGGNSDQEPLYICRSYDRDLFYPNKSQNMYYYPGKYLASNGICYLPYGGKELKADRNYSQLQLLFP